MRRAAALAASCIVAVAAPAWSQSPEIQDLGHGIYRAAGVMGGTAVRVPQRNTFMIVTRGALEARLTALRWLDAHSGNSNERGWLAAGICDAEARLKP